MGHYTRLTFWATVTDPVAVRVLQWMAHARGIGELPDHPLFAQPRAETMLSSNIDAHQVGATMFRPSEWEPSVWLLNVDLSHKDYRNEIALFLDWLSPYDPDPPFAGEIEFRGFIAYEDETHPTLIYRIGGGYALLKFDHMLDSARMTSPINPVEDRSLERGH